MLCDNLRVLSFIRSLKVPGAMAETWLSDSIRRCRTVMPLKLLFCKAPRPIWKSRMCVRLVGKPSAAMRATLPCEHCAASRKMHLQVGGQGKGWARRTPSAAHSRALLSMSGKATAADLWATHKGQTLEFQSCNPA